MTHRPTRPRPARRTGRQAGFTLVEIMIVVLIIGVLLNIATPGLVSARDKSQARSCVKNLNDLQLAQQEYAIDNRLAANSTRPFGWSDLSPYMKAPSWTPASGPTCPASNFAYNYGTMTTAPTCTYGGPAGHPENAHVVSMP